MSAADNTIRLGTRGSDLALWQAETVSDLLSRAAPMKDVEIIKVKTLGDRVLDKKITELGRTAVFTAELDQALLDGQVELGVHSLKDVETLDAVGIVLAGVLPRGPIEDVLVSKYSLDDLPKGAKVGTGSVRRTAQLARLRPDLELLPIRGNVPTRLEKLDSGEYDALVMARAGLVRLGLAHRISEVFSPEKMLPAVGQGAVAITIRSEDEMMSRIISQLNHAPTWQVVRAERACLNSLGAGCNVPLGTFCTLEGESLRMRAGVFSLDGSQAIFADESFDREGDPEEAGRRVADLLRENGADSILDSLRGKSL